MPTILSEDPTTLFFVFGAMGLIAAAATVMTGRGVYLLGVVLAVALTGVVVLIDFLIVTDLEQVEINTYALAHAAEQGDIDGVGKLISEDFKADGHSKESLLRSASRHLPKSESDARRVRFWNAKVEARDDGQVLTCSCSCRVDGATYRGYETGAPVYLEFDFMKDDDSEWRIHSIRVYDAVTGSQRYRIPH